MGLYDVNGPGVEALAAELGSRCFAAELDVTDADAFAEAADSFQNHFGRFDVILNNAGVLQMGRFEQVPLKMHTRTLDVNIGGVVNGVAAALPHLRANAGAHGRAHIINMCSASSLYGTPDHSTYSASKFAVRGLTEALNLEFESQGIVVCDVLPAYVDTEMISEQEDTSQLVESMGLEHTPAEVAELIWAAASGEKLHWFGNRQLSISDRLTRLFPTAARAVFRRQLEARS